MVLPPRPVPAGGKSERTPAPAPQQHLAQASRHGIDRCAEVSDATFGRAPARPGSARSGGGGAARERPDAGDPAVLPWAHGRPQGAVGTGRPTAAVARDGDPGALARVEGVAQLVDAPTFPGSIVLADAGDGTLAGLATPLAVDELIRLAVELAREVAGMHSRGVIHRNITPSNIVVSRGGAPCLVDAADHGAATSPPTRPRPRGFPRRRL
jgi:hypothetical protein